MERTAGKGALIVHGQVYVLYLYTCLTCLEGPRNLRLQNGDVVLWDRMGLTIGRLKLEG